MIRVEGRTAYVGTVREAMDASALDVDDVVVEDNAERIKLQRLLRDLR